MPSGGTSSAALRARLGPSVAAVGFDRVSDTAWAMLAHYATELSTWNQSINLTAARTPEEVARQIEECLPLLPHLPSEAGAKVVDVGAGGGLPGLVLASFRPELDWTLVEPVRKKHAFLRAAVRAMGIQADCRAVRDDAVEPGLFVVALTRATWPMDEWLARGRRLVEPGGRVLGLEGKERRELPAEARRVPYQLGGRQRMAVILDVPG